MTKVYTSHEVYTSEQYDRKRDAVLASGSTIDPNSYHERLTLVAERRHVWVNATGQPHSGGLGSLRAQVDLVYLISPLYIAYFAGISSLSTCGGNTIRVISQKSIYTAGRNVLPIHRTPVHSIIYVDKNRLTLSCARFRALECCPRSSEASPSVFLNAV